MELKNGGAAAKAQPGVRSFMVLPQASNLNREGKVAVSLAEIGR